MDENIWRLTQVFMWIIGLQTTFLIAVVGSIWYSLNNSSKEIKASLDKTTDKLNDIEKRVVVIETMLHMKE